MSDSLWASQPHRASKIYVVGGSGNGKSHWAQRVLVAPTRRVLVFDPEREFNWLGEGPIGVDELEDRVEEFRSGVLRVAVQPRRGRPWMGEGGEHERFCRAALRISHCLTVHEEISHVAGAGPSQLYQHFRDLVLTGRHDYVSCAVTGQFPALFPTAFRSSVTRVVAFGISDAKQARSLEPLIGEENAQRVHALPPHHFLDWRRGVGASLHSPLEAGRSTAT